MHELIQSYGNQIVQQALDDIFIHDHINEGHWRWILVRKGLVRHTTKTIRIRYTIGNITHEYQTIDGMIKRVALEPYKKHMFTIRNGRNSVLFRIEIKSIDIPQLLEELSNETNQTSEHGESQ